MYSRSTKAINTAAADCVQRLVETLGGARCSERSGTYMRQTRDSLSWPRTRHIYLYGLGTRFNCCGVRDLARSTDERCEVSVRRDLPIDGVCIVYRTRHAVALREKREMKANIGALNWDREDAK